MKWYSYLICCCLIVAGIFCTINLVDLWSHSSGVYGQPITIETKSEYDEVAKFDYGTVQFESEDYVNYECVTSFEPIKFDGTKKNYALLFNNSLCSNIQIYAGQINGDLAINFYDTFGEKVSVAKVNFEIKFFDSNTVIKISMVNEENSYAYITQYMNLNGAILKIVERS